MTKKKSFKTIITVVLIILACIVLLFGLLLYQITRYFFKYNEPGDVWFNEEYGITVTYVSGTPTITEYLFGARPHDEFITATIDCVDVEFHVDTGTGHQTDFIFIDEQKEKYALYGEYEMKNSKICEVWFNDSWNEFDEYWKNYNSETVNKLRELVKSENHIYLKKKN